MIEFDFNLGQSEVSPLHLQYMSDEELYRRAIIQKYSQIKRLTLDFPVAKKPKEKGSHPLIPCDGFLGKERVQYTVAAGKWDRLTFTAPTSGKVNLLDLQYLYPLIPKTPKQIHLVTYQNGIQNSPSEFAERGNSILSKIQGKFLEDPLMIGFYNPTMTLPLDLFRSSSHLQEFCTATVLRTRIFFTKILELLQPLPPYFRWLHIMHSEAGAIGHHALHLLSKAHKDLMKKHLITLAYAPLIPTPTPLVLSATNTYSTGDKTTLRHGRTFSKKPGYKIKEVRELEAPPPPEVAPPFPINLIKDQWDSTKKFYHQTYPVVKKASETLIGILPTDEVLNRLSESIPPGDHDFLGLTYQTALKDDIDRLVESLKQ